MAFAVLSSILLQEWMVECRFLIPYVFCLLDIWRKFVYE